MELNVSRLPAQIKIGYVGENDARAVSLDWSDWAERYGAGVLTVLFQRHGDDAPYPVVTTTEGAITTWAPSATDTAVPGYGYMQLRYSVGDVIAKSEILDVMVGTSLTAEADPPDPYESWLDTLTALGAETEANAQDAQAAQTAAEAAQAETERYATQAGQSAQSASQSAQSARDALSQFVSVTASAETLPTGSRATASYSNGHFSFGIPKGERGATGAKGDKGDKGDTGATGAKGDKGDKGDTGAQGVQGIQGEKGDTGLQGVQGEKGDPGADPVAFTLTLPAASWSSGVLTVSDARLLTGAEYCYMVYAAPASTYAWQDANVYADDVTTSGQMVFHSDNPPESDLTANVIRLEVAV